MKTAAGGSVQLQCITRKMSIIGINTLVYFNILLVVKKLKNMYFYSISPQQRRSPTYNKSIRLSDVSTV